MNNEGVAAVDRALSILDAFTENDASLTLTEISKRTGFYKSTTMRLAESLEKFGYLRRDDEGYYKLGSKPLFLGTLYQRQFKTADHVPQALRAIVAELHEGASFFIRDGNHRVCLHRVDPLRAIRDSISEGDRLPINVGASGHVILAFEGMGGQRYDEIREKLYSASFGERDPETAAVSCPVFGLNQKLAGAIAVSGPRYRIEETGVDKILPVIFQQARALTQAFGGNPNVFDKAGSK
ncbi:IclR family transcriptional regulator [Noviherbaspirillum denitrificans]|uniref:IclR family transcriptional regulator n=1 Tax=Noviherbaspirillum denitrificans TaxID=1968433 RepID=A0A254T9Q1_9BURK|nr:IclR family transcriptional regulator [Noviherbaspirillum denitrificans]OWW18042.1 IclR family transcriptional regulator [Noviherbaspirillum denitrificans]